MFGIDTFYIQYFIMMLGFLYTIIAISMFDKGNKPAKIGFVLMLFSFFIAVLSVLSKWV